MVKNNDNRRKIFSISMVKNEVDIIESFVRYHCNIFDGMVIKDNFSSDNTLKILEHLKLEGKPVDIVQDSSMEFNQSEKMTDLLYYTINKYNPDIIVPLDADEFLISSNNSGNPVNILNKIHLNKVYRINWRNYIPDISDDINEKFIPKRIRYARLDKYEYKKVIIPKEAACKNSLKLSMGSHLIQNRKDLAIEIIHDLKLAHFPVRSIKQIKSKIFTSWINNLSRYNRTDIQCWHWRQLFEKFKNNEELDQNDLIEIAKGYCSREKTNDIITTPKPIDFSFCESLEIKYTQDKEIKPLKNLLENCELLAHEYASMKKKYLKAIDSRDD